MYTKYNTHYTVYTQDKYSDFGHVEGYISETVQGTASGTINDP